MANVKIKSAPLTRDRKMERSAELELVRRAVSDDMSRLHRIFASLECSETHYGCNDVVDLLAHSSLNTSFFSFAEDVISSLRAAGKCRTAETYTSSLNSFRRFTNGGEVSLEKMDSDMLVSYEAYLKRSGVSANSSSFYMRNLRALYNRAVDKNLIIQQHPFRHVYTGVERTQKRAVSLKVIRQIKELDLTGNRAWEFARDMFLFSFYTRGMSFVDMAYLRKVDLRHGVLAYRRRKTGQQLFVKWESCMQDIVDKYKKGTSSYLLPIIKSSSKSDREQYLYASHRINRHLRCIGKMLMIPIPLTMYVARHAWASIARSKKVPLSVISESMGHDSEATTRIYLASLDNVVIDRANSLILRAL